MTNPPFVWLSERRIKIILRALMTLEEDCEVALSHLQVSEDKKETEVFCNRLIIVDDIRDLQNEFNNLLPPDQKNKL